MTCEVRLSQPVGASEAETEAEVAPERDTMDEEEYETLWGGDPLGDAEPLSDTPPL